MTGSLIKNARTLRTHMTDAERIIWHRLRAEQMGVRFRRQAPIGRYIVDFVCFSHKLVIEIDGGQHANSTSDAVRDAFLEAQGFKVLRFWNHEVVQQLEGVYEVVRLALLELTAADSLAPKPRSPTPPKVAGQRDPLRPHKGAGPEDELRPCAGAGLLLPPPSWGRVGVGVMCSDVGARIGVAQGVFDVPENIDQHNVAIANLFLGADASIDEESRHEHKET